MDGNRDIAAVKLAGSDGTELWRYQTASSTSSSLGAGGFGISFVLGVAVDGSDNPILVGSTYNSLVEGIGIPGGWDFFAIKLEGATGEELWRIQGGAPILREGLRGVKVGTCGLRVLCGCMCMCSSLYDTAQPQRIFFARTDEVGPGYRGFALCAPQIQRGNMSNQ